VTSSSNRIRVLCVDDHPIVRNGIAMIIGLQRDMSLVASASTAEEGLEAFRRHKPDITLMDLRLPCMTGVEAIRQIRKIDAAARVVVLTMYSGDEDIFRALEAGASTYLLKETLTDDVVRTIRDVHRGATTIPSDVAARLTTREGSPSLSRREIEVLEHIAKGMRNKEIAPVMGISEETVHAHIKHIFGKLGVSDRTAALTVALRRGLIHLQ
jgi:DNA-binding NarL/FixJ family response regulator